MILLYGQNQQATHSYILPTGIFIAPHIFTTFHITSKTSLVRSETSPQDVFK